MTRHWSERLVCQCGMSFRSNGAEAQHRHNFPLMCRKPKALRVHRPPPSDRDGTPEHWPVPVNDDVQSKGDAA